MKPVRHQEQESKAKKFAMPAVVLLVLLACAYGVFHVVSGDSPRKRVLDTVAIKLVPPPPPPPKDVPPPPKIVEEQKIEPPSEKPEAPKNDEPPPGPLALDAKGEAGSDAFGLGGKIGGADYTGGGGGSRFTRYADMMGGVIQKALHDDDKLGAAKYRATVKIWLTDAGKVQRIEVMHGSGDNTIDARIEQVIAAMPALPEAPPKDIPPVILRIGARAGLG